MLGSEVLEIALGLVLTYLLLSIIMTGVEELISSIFKTRSNNLEKALLQIMQGDDSLVKSFYEHPLVSALYRGTYEESKRRFLPWRNALPSYIPRETFAAAVTDLYKRAPEAQAWLGDLLALLPAETQGRARTATQKIEAWYDGAMDRASGWYKRRTQTRLFVIGLVGSIVFNVNSISLAHYLAVHPEQRELVTKLADRVASEGSEASRPAAGSAGGGTRQYCVREGEQTLVVRENQGAADVPAEPFDASENAAADAEMATLKAAPAPAPATIACWTPEQVRGYADALIETGVPVGWSKSSSDWLFRGFPEDDPEEGRNWLAWTVAWLLILFGYFITAVAIVLGAPFWFDVLNKIMVIRGTVKPKEKSPDEPPVDGPKRQSKTG